MVIKRHRLIDFHGDFDIRRGEEGWIFFFCSANIIGSIQGINILSVREFEKEEKEEK